MASPNRSAIIARLQKVLKKHYKPVEPNLARPLLEQMVFACLLENAHYTPAETAFKALSDLFFDWNEVRVSTTQELADVLPMLPDPTAAANRLKRVLQSVFESMYSFDLEPWKKQSQGAVIKRLEKLDGAGMFVVAYVVQTGLGGHSIPVCSGLADAAAVLGLVSEAEHSKGIVPGLERAVPKSRGAEFASLVHQLGADFAANPFSPNLHKVLLEIAPDSKERLPKRLTKKQRDAQAAAEAARAAEAKAKHDAKLAAAKKAELAKKIDAAKKAGRPEAGKKEAAPAKAPAAPAKKKPPAKAESKAEAAKGAGVKGAPKKKAMPAAQLSKKKPR